MTGPLKVVALLQARMSSTRLPGKVLKPLLGKPMLLRQIERLQHSRMIDKLVVVTSTDALDDQIENVCRENGLDCFRGSLDDVLDRYAAALEVYPAEHVVRLTGDCPLADWRVIDQVVRSHLESGAKYTANTIIPTYPDGLDTEVITAELLQWIAKNARLKSEREHVTYYINSRPDHFQRNSVVAANDYSMHRWTVDAQDDFDFVQRVYEELYPANPDFDMQDILALLALKPELPIINTGHIRNEGLLKSLVSDGEMKMNNRYASSEEYLERALKTIPLASQTFSKSITSYPRGVAPLFISKGKGALVWDVDGNEYVDFVSALASVTLGYCDPDVDAAVKKQMESGVVFSLPHPIEAELAERLVEEIPCAEMVRFGKNGSDATSAAIRIARAATGKDLVAVCGYHGWQDWYIGSTTRNLGVPRAVQELTHKFNYNDLSSLEELVEKYRGQFAALIMEPMNVQYPDAGFLEGVREITEREGIVLIFDETITGFRLARGGAQQLLGVTPDMATFGKGLANGFPISAVVGKRSLMRYMEDIFFSGTFGGETLSIAAACAVIDKLRNEPVLETISRRGSELIETVNSLIKKHNADSMFSLSGHPSWSFLNMKAAGNYSIWQIRTLFLQEMFANGILTLGTHNLGYSHGDAELQRLYAAYDKVLPLIVAAVNNQTLEAQLRCAPLEPLFKVR